MQRIPLQDNSARTIRRLYSGLAPSTSYPQRFQGCMRNIKANNILLRLRKNAKIEFGCQVIDASVDLFTSFVCVYKIFELKGKSYVYSHLLIRFLIQLSAKITDPCLPLQFGITRKPFFIKSITVTYLRVIQLISTFFTNFIDFNRMEFWFK